MGKKHASQYANFGSLPEIRAYRHYYKNAVSFSVMQT